MFTQISYFFYVKTNFFIVELNLPDDYCCVFHLHTCGGVIDDPSLVSDGVCLLLLQRGELDFSAISSCLQTERDDQ